LSCASSSNVCAAGGGAPINITSLQVAGSGQLYSLRFSGYDDTANVLTIDGQSIIYSYTSTTANLRDLASTHGAFKPRFFSAHIPPENILASWAVQPDMEIQFHHSASDGTFAIVSFYFKSTVGADSGPFAFFDPSALTAGSTTAQGVNVFGLQAFFDGLESNFQNSYYYYEGSLTVPP